MYPNTIDLNLLLSADSLHSFIPFLDGSISLSREIENDYLFLLLSKTVLTKKAKIALATVIIYKSNYFGTKKIGSIFPYFFDNLKRNQFKDIKLL